MVSKESSRDEHDTGTQHPKQLLLCPLPHMHIQTHFAVILWCSLYLNVTENTEKPVVEAAVAPTPGRSAQYINNYCRLESDNKEECPRTLSDIFLGIEHSLWEGGPLNYLHILPMAFYQGSEKGITWLLKCVSTSRIRVTWELTRNADFGLHARSPESKSAFLIRSLGDLNVL